MPIIEDIVEHEGIELVDVTYRRESEGWILRVFLDKAGGVTVDDCGYISRQVSDVLDVKAVIPHAYKLEVSSPGLNRPLTKPKDFAKLRGEQVRLATHTPIENRKNFIGKLIDYKDGTICLNIDGQIFFVPHDLVHKANLIYDFEKREKT